MTASNPVPAVERDPICGMKVDPATAKHVVEHDGVTHYFCGAGCAAKFKSNLTADPNKTTSPGTTLLEMPAAAKSAPASGSAYLCPMCPEVHESKPGACPSCGMALERDLAAGAQVEYTCPMHAEIVRSEPGSCPICGMALEPRTVTVAQEENPELRGMTRRFWV